jgi:hypothetical protein
MAALGTWEVRGVCYGGGEVATEHVLDLDRGDVLSAGGDHICGAVLERHVAASAGYCRIPGMGPAAAKALQVVSGSLRSGRREGLVEGLEEEVGVLVLEYQGRPDLEHVSGGAGGAEQDPALAHRLGHLAGLPGRGRARPAG